MAIGHLVMEIEDAWSAAHYPEGDGLTVHPLGLDEEFYEGFVDKSWDSLSPSFLTYHADCIGLLTPKGFQYFLPAFLISDLQLGANTNIRFWIFGALQGCLGGGSYIKELSGPDWFRSRITGLTPRQKSCVIKFIDFSGEGDLDNCDLIVEHIKNT